MRRARIVRIEYDTKALGMYDGDMEISNASILASVAAYYALDGVQCFADGTITVSGEPSFEVKEREK